MYNKKHYLKQVNFIRTSIINKYISITKIILILILNLKLNYELIKYINKCRFT